MAVFLTLPGCKSKATKFILAQRINGVGIALYTQGKVDEALERFKKAIDYAPDFAFVRNNAGVAYYHLNQLDLSMAQFRRAIEIDPDTPEIHGNMGAALLVMERFEEAEKELIEAIRLDPEYLLAYSNLGVLRYRTGRVEEAIATYRKGLDIDSSFDRLHHNLGEALMSQGRYTEAVKHYNRVLELNPDNTRTFNNLAWAFAQRGENIEDALALANAALEQDQGNGFFYDTLGWIHFQQGLFDEAYQVVSKAIQFQPAIPEIRFHMGEILRWQGKFEEAVEEYGRVIGLEPYGEWADKAQKAIWSIKGL